MCVCILTRGPHYLIPPPPTHTHTRRSSERDRQADRQAGRQAGRQIDRQTETENKKPEKEVRKANNELGYKTCCVPILTAVSARCARSRPAWGVRGGGGVVSVPAAVARGPGRHCQHQRRHHQ